MKRVNTRGIQNANKHVLIAALTYNLKKYLRFVVKEPSILSQVLSLKQGKNSIFIKTFVFDLKSAIIHYLNFTICISNPKNNLA